MSNCSISKNVWKKKKCNRLDSNWLQPLFLLQRKKESRQYCVGIDARWDLSIFYNISTSVLLYNLHYLCSVVL